MLTVSIMIILSFTIFVLDLVWVNVMVVTLIGHTAFILYYLNKILEYSNGKLVSNGSKISCPVYFEKKKKTSWLHCYFYVLLGLFFFTFMV